MLIEITLQNFKGYRDRTTIPLAPITLLYGPNSAGKSSIFHALLYLYEVLQNDWCDVDGCTLAPVDLGGFSNLVNRDSDEDYFRLGVKFKTSAEITRQLPGWDDPDEVHRLSDEHDLGLTAPNGEGGANYIGVELEIRWSEGAEKPYVAVLLIELDEKPFLRIQADSALAHCTIDKINFSHYFLGGDENRHGSTAAETAVRELLALESASDDEGVLQVPVEIAPAGAKPQLDQKLSFSKGNQRLMEFSEGFGIKEEREGVTDEEVQSFHKEWGRRCELLQLLEQFFSEAVVASLNELAVAIESFASIGPMRTLPARGFVPRRRIVPVRWYEGLAGWDAVANCSAEEFEKISQWMFRLRTGYSLVREKDTRKEKPIRAGSSITEVRLQDVNGNLFKPRDVGIGISQLLPVVAATNLVQIGVVYVEQPELHIHPSLQVELGDLLCAFIPRVGPWVGDCDTNDFHPVRDEDKTFLIETHSEHLLLRILKRIRQTSADELPDPELALYPDDVAVIYVDNKKGASQIKRLRIDEEGEFIDRWPAGFFTERADELF